MSRLTCRLLPSDRCLDLLECLVYVFYAARSSTSRSILLLCALPLPPEFLSLIVQFLNINGLFTHEKERAS